MNDGYVEFCVLEADTALRATIQSLQPGLLCGPWHGRAGCDKTQGELLCTFQTEFPAQCTATEAMTPETWANMCKIASLPPITEIVHTFFE
ncbi:MAG: hypothetical protein AB7O24_24525 [Kofleriaceae bacterium]